MMWFLLFSVKSVLCIVLGLYLFQVFRPVDCIYSRKLFYFFSVLPITAVSICSGSFRPIVSDWCTKKLKTKVFLLHVSYSCCFVSDCFSIITFFVLFF